MAISKYEEIILFEPYESIFEPGDALKLKSGNEFRRIHNEWMRLIKEEGIPVDWCPPKKLLEEMSDIVFKVEGVMFFHGGVPLYILSYGDKKIRLCESLLTKVG